MRVPRLTIAPSFVLMCALAVSLLLPPVARAQGNTSMEITPPGELPSGGPAIGAPGVASEIALRQAWKELGDAIRGTLLYFDDRQIRPRVGQRNIDTDSSLDGDGCKIKLSLNLPWKENIGVPAPSFLHGANRTGEWASYVHFLPKRIGFKGRAPCAVQDSNLFMTAFTAYPLYLFDESGLPADRHYIDEMLHLAMKNVQSFKRGGEYNFWAVLPGVRSPSPRVGPFNIPVELLEKLAKAYLNPRLKGFWNALSRGLKVPPPYWLETCLDAKQNPTGADALFNIPNDADDTSTAVSFQACYARRFPMAGVAPDLPALAAAAAFRDIDRVREDGRDTWKGKDSGAFLTWMRDEREPTFSRPETGIIPLGVNNVDVVVNANVAFALALTGQKDLPGYAEALSLMARAIEQKAWPEAGLYYPQFMIFPYTATRAWRDGGAREGPMTAAMEKLLRDLLQVQRDWGRAHPDRFGAFPGGEDRSDHLATALGVTSLINLGQPTAERLGLTPAYRQAVKAGIAYLLQVKKNRDPRNPESARRFSAPNGKTAEWESGLFFAASFWDLGHWRSQAFTEAMVLEALTKYALAYDLDDCPFAHRRLRLRPTPR